MFVFNPLDPDAVVGDVEIVEDIRRIVLSEYLMDGQQTFQDASFPSNQLRVPLSFLMVQADSTLCSPSVVRTS